MNILLTSVGRRTYMIDYFKNAIGKSGKVFAANSEYTYSMSHADEYVITPLIYDEIYIDFIMKYCKKKSITAVISLFDIDLLVLSQNINKFASNGIKVVVSDEKIITLCNDKWETFCFLRNHGINVPLTFINITEAKKAIETGQIKYPIIIKPRWGMGSIGIFEAENEEELELFCKKTMKKIFSSYLKFESKKTEKESVIFQEKVDGFEYGLDILNDFNGKYAGSVAKKKINMRAGETDIAEIVQIPYLETLAKDLSNTVKHIGNLDVDVFSLPNREYCVLELNCRFGGQYPFSHLSGVDFPKQIINWLEGNKNDIKLLTVKKLITACKDLVPEIIYE